MHINVPKSIVQADSADLSESTIGPNTAKTVDRIEDIFLANKMQKLVVKIVEICRM